MTISSDWSKYSYNLIFKMEYDPNLTKQGYV